MRSFISKLLFPLDNINEVAINYADILGLQVAAGELQKLIDEHPDYPSLLALSDSFSSLGVESLALKLNPEQLASLDVPFIAQILPKDDVEFSFTIVIPKSKGACVYLHPFHNKWLNVSIQEFRELSTGIVLLAEKGENKRELNLEGGRKTERRSFTQIIFITLFVFFIFLSAIGNAFWLQGWSAMWVSMHLLLVTIGSVVTSLLVWFEVDEHNQALRGVCSGSRNVSCAAILQSGASSILGIKWSVIGFTYFVGSMTALLSAALSSSISFILSWLNIAALPYAFFSLYYQWKIVKQWCVLCLWVQGILLVQAGLTLAKGGLFASQPSISMNDVFLVSVCFLLPFISVSVVIPAFKKVKEGRNYRNELMRMKRKSEIFRILLEKQKKVTFNPDGLGITIGKPKAKYKIIKVCNPYCEPCANAHPILEEILNDNLNVQIQIIFTAEDSETDLKAPPVKHLMAIAEKGNEEMIRRALEDWYGTKKKDYGIFASKYPMNGELARQGSKLAAMRIWCNQMNTNVTPTFFVDGYQLPDLYTLQDLKFLLKP